MPFKHSFNILINKYNLVFKFIVYFAIILLILVSIALSLISPMFKRVREEVKETNITTTLKEATTQFLSGDEHYHDTLEKLTIDWRTVVESFKDTNLVSASVVVGVFVLFILFFLFLSYYTLADILNEYMLNYAKYGFLSNLISNIGKSSLYSLLNLLISTAFNFIMLFGGYFLYLGISKILSFLIALPVVMFFLIMISALQNTLLCCWLPSMVREKDNIIKAINGSFKTVKPVFGQAFGLFATINFLAIIWIFICAMPTLGAGIIIAIPSVIIFKRIAELVVYYNAKGYRYYLEKDTVVSGGYN